MNTAIQQAPSADTAACTAGAALAEPAQYLTFLLGGEMFAIAIRGIKEIIEYRDLTVVPLMPPSVRGVINLRGAVVPVMDLQARFGRTPSVVGRRTCMVIVEVAAAEERQTMGVIVDAVCEVVDVAAADIEPPPAFGARIRADFIRGMGKVKGRLVILLDAARALSPDEVGAPAPMPPALSHAAAS